MALPKITHTIYKHFLVGLGKEISYRPFTNQEQKTLLLAKQEGNKQATINAVKQIVQQCTMGALDASKLSVFDMEDLFLRIRSKSVSEIAEVRYRHDFDDEEGRPTSKFIDVVVKLDDVKVTVDPEHKKIITLSDDISIVMTYPTFDMVNLEEEDIPMYCIESVVDSSGNVFLMSDYTEAERRDFFDQIDMKGLLEIKRFFDTSPKLKHTIQVPLSDGTKQEVVLEGLESFFS